MMISSGLLLFRMSPDEVLEVLIAHMGGPYWERKHKAAWSIPKGLAESGEEDLIKVAEREFAEEMGSAAPAGESIELGTVRSGKKKIYAFAREGAFDLGTFQSNHFEMEWPKGSGVMQSFPEVDKADWVTVASARELLVKSQVAFIDRLVESIQ